MRKMRIFALTLSIIMLCGLMAACSNSSSSGTMGQSGTSGSAAPDAGSKTASTAAQKDASPRKISIMTQTFGENPPPDNFIVKAIQDATNSSIEFRWTPSTSYKDKVNVVLAAGDLPNIMLVTDPKQSSFVTACQQGAFWEVERYLKEFPVFLSKMDPVRTDMTRINGKLYGLYRHRNIGRSGYVVRKDWLDNLGLSTPKTVDEFYSMLVKFVNDDPDKNGKKDTFGAVTEKGHSFAHLIAPFGAPNTWWIDSSGNIKNAAESKEYLEGIKYVRKLYSEGLLNKDFLVATDSGALFRKGNAGVRMGGTVDDMDTNWTEVTQNYPNAAFDGIPRLQGPAGSLIHSSGGGFNGVYSFPTTSNKSENDLRFMLNFLDKISEVPLINTLCWGIEGTHYARDGNSAFRKDKGQADTYARDAYSLIQLYLSNANAYKSNDKRTLRAEELVKFNEESGHVVIDPMYTLVSPTWSTKSSELTQILNDARGNFITGAINEDGFKREVQKFLDNGGAQAAKEFKPLYEASKKK